MGEMILKPDAVVQWRGGFVFQSVGLVEDLADSSDSTFVRLGSAWTDPYYGQWRASLVTYFESAPLPFKARIIQMYPQTRIANVAGELEQFSQRMWIASNNQALPLGQDWPTARVQTAQTNVVTFDGENAQQYNDGRPLDQYAIDNVGYELFRFGSVSTRIYKVRMIVHYDEQPNVSITGPSGEIDNPTPLIGWEFFDDLQGQYAYQVQILNAAGAVVHDTNTVISSESFHQYAGPRLANGSYTVKVRAAQNWVLAGGLFWSEWDTSAFDVDTTGPIPPTLTTVDQPGHIEIDSLSYLNLLPINAASFELAQTHPDWYSFNNMTVSSSASSFARNGGRTARLVPTGSSAAAQSIQVPCVAGSRYYASVWTRTAPGTSNSTTTVSIAFYNSAGSSISTSAGSATANSSTWSEAVHTATAPANSVWMAVRVTIAATSGTFLLDDAFITHLPTGYSAPSFAGGISGRGGIYSVTNNLLSMANATIDTDHKWVATHPATAPVTVEGESYTSQSNWQTVSAGGYSGGAYANALAGLSWMRYSGVTTVRLNQIVIHYAALGSDGAIFEIRDNSDTGTILGTWTLPATGGALSTFTIFPFAGTGSMVFRYINGSVFGLRIDKYVISYSSAGVDVTRDLAVQRHGAASMKMYNDTLATFSLTACIGSVSETGALTESSNYFEVTPGEVLNLQGSVYSPATSRTYNLYLAYWTDPSSGSFTTTVLSGSTSVGNWVDIANTVTVPAGAKYAKLYAAVLNTAFTEAHYWDRFGISRRSEFPFSLWQEGMRVSHDFKIFVEWSENGGTDWYPLADSSALSISEPIITFRDYEVRHNTDRIYRAYVTASIEGQTFRTDYSASTAANQISLPHIWLHAMDDPEGTIHNFVYDGHSARSETYDSGSKEMKFAGRDFPVTQFGEDRKQGITFRVQLASEEDREAYDLLLRRQSLMVFRDQRGRRARGSLRGSISDEQWGQEGNGNFDYSGDQP